MTTNAYDLGTRVRVSTVFTDLSGVAADPTTIICRYESPSAAKTVLTYGTDAALAKDSTGHYHADIDTTEAGTWSYRFEGTGAIVAVDQGTFLVRATLVPA